MALRPEDLPSDPAALAEMVLAFEGENDDLRAEIATLKSLIFGARSERAAIVCAEQIAFDLERTAGSQLPANDDKPDAPRPERRKAKRNIGALPAHLPRVERVIEPASTLCPCCTGQMHRIGEESSEALDRVPAWLRVLRTIRPKYACRSCEGPIVQAPAPARLVEGGMATTALIAHIAAAKYAWQSTLYRQTQILAGQGVVVDRQTLARWMGSAAWLVRGLYDLQLKTMHGFERLFCDETPMPVLDPGRGRTRICQFWAHATDDRAWKGPAAIEERIRGLDAGERRATRQAETKPLMEALRARLIAVKDGISRRSTLIKAIDYMLERWQGLTTFLDDGRLEPDTNTVERSIRPIAIGKKNSLFSGDEGGGETWAILASLLNTAKLNGLDPEAYLVDVLDRMVSGATKTNQLHELLAWNWKAAREAEKRAVA